MKWKELLRRMCKSKFFIIGSILVLFIVIVSLIAPGIVVHDPIKADLKMRLLQPEFFSNGWSGHVLGTDQLGQDVLTRLLIGSRSSLFIACISVAVSGTIGTVLGIISGYYGRFVENLIMRICDIQMAIPSLILAICALAILGNTMANLIAVIIISTWVAYARLVRGNVLTIRTMEYIQASKVLGASSVRVMATQILPNVLTSLIILMSQQFGTIILMEAGLSFLGMGIPVPTPSWGAMIADGREYITTAPWVVIAPGIALMVTVLAFNFLGDGIRDVLDPKNQD